MQASGRWVRLAICGVLALAFSALAPERPQAQQAAPAAGLEPLAIVSASGRHEFQVEVMRTPEQRARGLMHRQFMPADRPGILPREKYVLAMAHLLQLNGMVPGETPLTEDAESLGRRISPLERP